MGLIATMFTATWIWLYPATDTKPAVGGEGRVCVRAANTTEAQHIAMSIFNGVMLGHELKGLKVEVGCPWQPAVIDAVERIEDGQPLNNPYREAFVLEEMVKKCMSVAGEVTAKVVEREGVVGSLVYVAFQPQNPGIVRAVKVDAGERVGTTVEVEWLSPRRGAMKSVVPLHMLRDFDALVEDHRRKAWDQGEQARQLRQRGPT